MSEHKLAGWAASSADPAEVSNRVKGIILALSSVVILVAANVFGISLSADNVVELATYIGTLAGALWTVWGAGVALVRWFATIQA